MHNCRSALDRSLGIVHSAWVDHAKLARLARLSFECQFEELIREVTEDEVAQAWTRYQQRYPDVADDDPDWWAVDLWMSEESWADERRIRDGILRLVDLANSDAELEFIGITAMEGWFFGEDPSRLEWVETHAAQSDRFRCTLGNLYLNRETDDVRERVERAAAGPLPRSGTDT